MHKNPGPVALGTMHSVVVAVADSLMGWFGLHFYFVFNLFCALKGKVEGWSSGDFLQVEGGMKSMGSECTSHNGGNTRTWNLILSMES